MRWRVESDHPFAGGAFIPAGTIVTEVWKRDLSATEMRYRKDRHDADRREKKPPSILVRWDGQIRYLSPLDMTPERVLVWDTETTGMRSPNKIPGGDQVIEVGAALIEWGEVVMSHARVVRCDPRYLTGQTWGRAQKVHGITRKEILAARTPVDVGRDLAAWYKRIGQPACAAYPTHFDSRMMSQTWPSLGLFWHPSLCIQKQWRGVMSKRHPKLSVAAELLGVSPPAGRAHRAEYDTLLAAGVMIALRQRKSKPSTPRLPLRAAAAEKRIQAAMEMG